MTKQLIPDEGTDRHVALLGMTGAGKTSVSKIAIVEPDLRANRRVIIMDPTGAWWGLRLKKDGKKPGFPIYIFGGDHGDYPLKAVNAGMLAEAFARSSDSAIFDMSMMTVSERTTFFTEFAETFRRRNKGWVRFVIDEAHLFMPQQGAKSGGGVPTMLHAGNNLVSLGRSRGLRVVMISQRASKLHKDSLTQASALIAMRVMHPLDRGAVEDWVKDQAKPGEGAQVIASLSHLKAGEAWVWAPLANMLERIQFPMPSTFDSSAAPDQGEDDGPQLEPINLDTLKGRLASVEADRKAQIAKLTAQVNAKPVAPAVDSQAIERARQEGRSAGEAETAPIWFRRGVEHMAEHIARLSQPEIIVYGLKQFKAVGALPSSVAAGKDGCRVPEPKKIAQVLLPPARSRQELPIKIPNPDRMPQTGIPTSSGNLSKAERKIMTALAQYPDGRTKSQIAILTGYAVSGGGFNNAISSLRSAGRLTSTGDLYRATAEGVDSLGSFDPLPHGDALLQHWYAQLGKAERACLEGLVAAYPNSLTKQDVAAAAGYEPSGGGFNNALSRLRTLELMTGRGDDLRASDSLFG